MADRNTCADEELIAAFRSGDKTAGELLLVRYKNKVRTVARQFFLAGGDTEDLVQEGMCGLYSAIMSFDGSGVFSAYAHACIRNRIYDAVKKSVGKASEYPVSFSEDGDGAVAIGFSPEEILIGSEAASEFTSTMKGALSDLEYSVMAMYIDGASMSEISDSLGITYKQTDNALMRAKQKLRRILNSN